MTQYAIIQDRLLTARIADSAVVNDGATYSGDALELPNPSQIARVISPVALFKCDPAGSPEGGEFALQVKSAEAADWRDISGAVFSVADTLVSKRIEIGALGAATHIRLSGRNLSGLSSSDFYTLTVSIEGAIA